MQRKNAKLGPINYRLVGKRVDPKILTLFPSLQRNLDTCTEKDAVLQRLTCLYLLGGCESASLSELVSAMQMPRATVAKELKKLVLMGLIESVKAKKLAKYSLSTKGIVTSMAFREYQEWKKIKAPLSGSQKANDPLAYALLTIGYAADSKPDGVYDALVKYAAQGHSLEGLDVDVVAESLLNFYRADMRACGPAPPNYLGVFKEFTTTGFQDVFRMLLMAIKPTADDYNWLVEFFNEVAEFYYDPSRAAYVNLLKENKALRDRLEEFKKQQDQLIKKDGSNLEVTFTVPSAGLQKIDTMPPHLRAMGMRLMLEPIKFINKELCGIYWENKK
jgi:hypothetical protein